MSFTSEIKTRSKSNTIKALSISIWQKYGDYLFGSDINSLKELTISQTAFLSIMDEKWKDLILPLVNVNVKAEFDDWYEEGGSYSQIRLQSIDLSQLESGNWQLMFEDENEDLIVHLYMEEWRFDYTARTG